MGDVKQSVGFEYEITAKLKLVKVTKGALQYQEIDEHGKIMEYNDARAIFGSVYLRQKGVRRLQEGFPQTVAITVKAVLK